MHLSFATFHFSPSSTFFSPFFVNKMAAADPVASAYVPPHLYSLPTTTTPSIPYNPPTTPYTHPHLNPPWTRLTLACVKGGSWRSGCRIKARVETSHPSTHTPMYPPSTHLPFLPNIAVVQFQISSVSLIELWCHIWECDQAPVRCYELWLFRTLVLHLSKYTILQLPIRSIIIHSKYYKLHYLSAVEANYEVTWLVGWPNTINFIIYQL